MDINGELSCFSKHKPFFFTPSLAILKIEMPKPNSEDEHLTLAIEITTNGRTVEGKDGINYIEGDSCRFGAKLHAMTTQITLLFFLCS